MHHTALIELGPSRLTSMALEVALRRAPSVLLGVTTALMVIFVGCGQEEIAAHSDGGPTLVLDATADSETGGEGRDSDSTPEPVSDGDLSGDADETAPSDFDGDVIEDADEVGDAEVESTLPRGWSFPEDVTMVSEERFDPPHDDFDENWGTVGNSNQSFLEFPENPEGSIHRHALEQSLDRLLDSNSFRTESRYRLPMFYDFGVDYWIQMEWMIGPEWDNLEPANESIIIMQQQATPDEHLGEPYNSPVLSFFVKGSRIGLGGKWDDGEVTTPNPDTRESAFRTIIDDFEVEREVLYSIVWHVRFDPFGDGRCRIWINGTQHVDYSGPLGFNDEEGPLLKTGLYLSNWRDAEDGLYWTPQGQHRQTYLFGIAVARGGRGEPEWP